MDVAVFCVEDLPGYILIAELLNGIVVANVVVEILLCLLLTIERLVM